MNINLIINPEKTVKDALKMMSVSGGKSLVVVSGKNLLLGTISGGDIRKSILSGGKLTDKIDQFYCSDPITFSNGNYTNNEVREIFKTKRIDIIPIINEKKELIEILEWSDFLDDKPRNDFDLKDTPVVIMAGGRGSRLEPFTNVLPKPLIPVHEKPIIEHIIEKFTDVGSQNFYLTINYKGKIMKAYFDELSPEYNVSFVEEIEPLGTAGSLRFLNGKFTTPFFVTNCDIIINIDYSNLMKYHKEEKNDITLVASTKEYIIPYGTCELNDKGDLSHINEKPKYDFLINTGLYILNPELLSLIPESKFYHITHLIEDSKNLGNKVGVYPIDDDLWIDIGQWAEYKQAIENYKK